MMGSWVRSPKGSQQEECPQSWGWGENPHPQTKGVDFVTNSKNKTNSYGSISLQTHQEGSHLSYLRCPKENKEMEMEIAKGITT